MLPAWMGTIVFSTLMLLMERHGGGVHIEDLPPAEVDQYLIYGHGSQVAARLSILFARTSILLLYLRIFYPPGVPRSATWWVILSVLTLNVLFCISYVLVEVLQCVPQGLPFGSGCVDRWSFLLSATLVNIVSDFAVMVVPLSSILKLQMNPRRKWLTGALFVLGALAPAISIIRLWFILTRRESMVTDITGTGFAIPLAALSEQSVAVIIGSTPVCNALVRRIVRRKPSQTPPHDGTTLSQRLWRTKLRYQGSGSKTKGKKHPGPFSIPDSMNLTGISTRTMGSNGEYLELTERNSTAKDSSQAQVSRAFD